MREVQIISFCDVDWKRESVKVPAVFTVTVTLDGREVGLDLCEDHAQTVREAMVMFDQFGTGESAPKKIGAPKKRTDCLLCDHVSASRGGLSQHYRAMHGTTIKEAEGKGVRPDV